MLGTNLRKTSAVIILFQIIRWRKLCGFWLFAAYFLANKVCWPKLVKQWSLVASTFSFKKSFRLNLLQGHWFFYFKSLDLSIYHCIYDIFLLSNNTTPSQPHQQLFELIIILYLSIDFLMWHLKQLYICYNFVLFFVFVVDIFLPNHWNVYFSNYFFLSLNVHHIRNFHSLHNIEKSFFGFIFSPLISKIHRIHEDFFHAVVSTSLNFLGRYSLS